MLLLSLSRCAKIRASISRVPLCLPRMAGFTPGHHESVRSRASYAGFGEARRACALRALAQVEPPGRGKADPVEGEIGHQRELRAAGERDRFAEAERDQEAADGADRADEADRSTRFDRRRLQRQ